MEYFINYQTERVSAPYKIDDDLKKKLVELGVNIIYEVESEPVVIGTIPDGFVEKVKEIESIVGIFERPLPNQ